MLVVIVDRGRVHAIESLRLRPEIAVIDATICPNSRPHYLVGAGRCSAQGCWTLHGPKLLDDLEALPSADQAGIMMELMMRYDG